MTISAGRHLVAASFTVRGTKMHYRSLADLSAVINKMSSSLAKDIDLIAGIPRSGLLAANLLALRLNLPLTDLEGLCHRRLIGAGQRLPCKTRRRNFDEFRHVLIIDDSVCSGNSLNTARELLVEAGLTCKLTWAAVYVAPGKESLVDVYGEICYLPRIFEWNYLHHGILKEACVDLDGVLCRDPTDEENDDGGKYLHFLANADIILRPSSKIGWIVTSRLEKYRKQTIEWLDKNNIQFEHLIMLDLPTAEDRRRLKCHALHKANAYTQTGASVFIESEPWQAAEIARRSCKPVICSTTGEMYYPNLSSLGKAFLRKLARVSVRRTHWLSSYWGSFFLRWLNW